MAVSDLIAQTLAQHISSPRVISYAGTKKDEVQGRFIAANRVYNFVLDKKGVSYSPAGRNDSLVFSALFLERLDAARKPKVGSDRCNAGKSYQCGKTCISNRWNCRKGVKDVNDARRIASILASTNEGLKARGSSEVSEKAQARGRALFEARQNRVENGKVARVNQQKNTKPSNRKSKGNKPKQESESFVSGVNSEWMNKEKYEKEGKAVPLALRDKKDIKSVAGFHVAKEDFVTNRPAWEGAMEALEKKGKGEKMLVTRGGYGFHVEKNQERYNITEIHKNERRGEIRTIPAKEFEKNYRWYV